MLRDASSCILVIAAIVALTPAAMSAETRFEAQLDGLNNVPPVLTTARAALEFTVDPARQTVEFALRYSGFEGQPTAATINFGPAAVNGASVVVLCSSPIIVLPQSEAPPVIGIPIVPVPACPTAGEGIIEGSFDETRVFAAESQGIDFNDFSDFLGVLNSERAYAAMASTRFPTGAIRGELRAARDPRDEIAD